MEPSINLLVVCDRVNERRDGKTDFVGVWNNVVFPDFPTRRFDVNIYAEAECGLPEYDVQIVLRTRYGEEFARETQGMKGGPTLGSGILWYRFLQAQFKSPGIYSVEIEFEGKVIASRWFTARASVSE